MDEQDKDKEQGESPPPSPENAEEEEGGSDVVEDNGEGIEVAAEIDNQDTSTWEGEGPAITTGPGAFTNHKAGVNIKNLPQMGCAPGRDASWHLRQIGYSKSRKKTSSGSSLYQFIGADLVHSNNPLSDIQNHFKLPPKPEYDTNGLPHSFILTLQLPYCEKPGMFGQRQDGRTVNAVFVYTLKKETIDLSVANKDDPAVSLLRRLTENLSETPIKASKDSFLGRTKLLVKSDSGVPSAFSKFNGKPVLITGSGQWALVNGSLQIYVNMRSWAYPARLALYSNWGKLSDYKLHVGICIEGRNDSELDERLLGCALVAYPTKVEDCPVIEV